jgi:hypothetical protein
MAEIGILQHRFDYGCVAFDRASDAAQTGMRPDYSVLRVPLEKSLDLAQVRYVYVWLIQGRTFLPLVLL